MCGWGGGGGGGGGGGTRVDLLHSLTHYIYCGTTLLGNTIKCGVGGVGGGGGGGGGGVHHVSCVLSYKTIFFFNH